MHIAIIGFDREGRSSYEYFKQQGHTITVCDQKTDIEVPADVESVLGADYLRGLDRFDLLVRTAGLPAERILAANPSVADKITTQVNEFFRVCPSTHIFGVTGTKGKGTTSTLLQMMLQRAGKHVVLGGNIGVPPLSLLDQITADMQVVLELSSYQLSDIHYAPHIAVCLMVVPEHLNWHGDMAHYVQAKSQLFSHQTTDDIAIYYGENETSRQIAANSAGRHIAYYSPQGAHIADGAVTIDGQHIINTSELKLIGEHHWQNVCAAVTAFWQVSHDVAAMHAILSTFTGLEHRVEKLRTWHDRTFYNDSFATGLHATEAAIRAVPGPKVVIVGGYDRMLELSHFGDFARTNAHEFRSLLLIGASAQRLSETLDAAGFDNYTIAEGQDMSAIVAEAVEHSQAGDSIILSPGFASFDMFKDFEDRGRQFKEAVAAL